MRKSSGVRLFFRGRFAALTMATDVTERRRVQHRNAVFSKLSHRLSSATTAAEAAMIICEAADELFKWDDFALDLYLAERDEVNSLLNITTVEGQRVEIPPSPQPKTVNALVQRVVTNGAGVADPGGDQKPFGFHDAGADPQRGAGYRHSLHSKPYYRYLYQGRFGDAANAGGPASGGAVERLRAEQGLRESQQRFRDLFEKFAGRDPGGKHGGE